MSGHSIVWETWTLTREADRAFRRILATVAVPLLILGLVIPIWKLQQKPPEQLTYKAGRYAQLLPQPPAPVVKPKPVQQTKAPTAKPKPKPVEHRPVPKPKPRPVPAKPKPNPTEVAKKQARKALQSSLGALASLRDQNLNALSSSTPLTTSAITSKGAVSGSEQSITKAAESGAAAPTVVGGGTVTQANSGGDIGNRQTAMVTGPAGVGRPVGAHGINRGRSLSDLQLVFDRNKGVLSTFYRAARRKNPSEQGKMIVHLVIAPDGHVVECRLVSSTLGDPELENKVIERIKLFNFGAKKVPTFTYNYPITFVTPS